LPRQNKFMKTVSFIVGWRSAARRSCQLDGSRSAPSGEQVAGRASGRFESHRSRDGAEPLWLACKRNCLLRRGGEAAANVMNQRSVQLAMFVWLREFACQFAAAPQRASHLSNQLPQKWWAHFPYTAPATPAGPPHGINWPVLRPNRLGRAASSGRLQQSSSVRTGH
jgi:hypothetical protein